MYFFFFIRDLRSRSDGANSPIRIRHSERAASFLFVSHGQPSASRLPYHPLRGWYHTQRVWYTQTPSGFVYRTPTGSGITPRWGVITRRLMRAHACALQFWPKTMRFRRKLAVGFWPKLWAFLSNRLPSGPRNPSGPILWPKL